MRKGHEVQWWENLCAFSGDMWVQFNPHSKRLEELDAPEHRVRLGINLIQPVVRTEYAKLLKNRPILECQASSNNKRHIDGAKLGDKVLNNYAEVQFGFPSIRREAVIWTLTCGMGSIFTDYDESSAGETEVLVDPNGTPIVDPAAIKAVQRYYRDKHRKPKTSVMPQGDARLRALGPMQWGWDFATNNPSLASWCYVSEVYDALEVKRRWGVEVETQKYAKPNMLERRLLEKADLTGTFNRQGSGSSPTHQDLVIIHRLFIRPGHYYFPDGAEIIFSEEDLIDATKYPFAHGQLPVSTMGHIPLPGSRYPLSTVGQVKDPVLELSKTESQLLENRNLMGNPPWIYYKQHKIEEDAIQNRPGLHLEINYHPGMPDPHPVEMPEMPTYIQNLPERLERYVQSISGQGETSQGRVPPGARSGVAIAYLQEEDDTKLGPTVLEFEEMIGRVGWQLLSVIAQNYDLPRTVRITKPNGSLETFDFIGSMLEGVEGVSCQAGSALPRSKAAKQQFILDLYSMGVETDPRKVKQMLELGEGEAEEWEMDMEQADRENDRMQRGQPQPVKEWYNHQAHILRHRRFMKSPDYEMLPDQIKQVLEDHDVLHQQYLTGVASAAQMGVPTPGQSIPQAQMGPGQNNQQAVQGGPLAQNGQTPQASTIDAQPQ